MQTIENIIFNPILYTSADVWTLLLYQKIGVTIPICLCNAQLMSFIRVFNDILQCHNHIDINPRKMITLFAYYENIQQWLSMNLSIPNNINTIKIFCPLNDQVYFTNWAKRYMQRYSSRIFDVFTFEELNHVLLLYGVELLKKRRPYLPSDSNLQDTLDSDYKKLCQALANYFLRETHS